MSPFQKERYYADLAARAPSTKWNIRTMTPGRDIMITYPNELAEVLLRIAVSNSTIMQLIRDIVTLSYQPKECRLAEAFPKGGYLLIL
jgi:hypothetical protein